MADILIRMEMPKHCFNCSTKIDPDNRKCNIDGHVFEETLSKLTCRRDEHCPLHELPEHGDLIDIRNAENAMFALGNYHLNDYKQGWNDGIEAVIENAPVIIPSNKENKNANQN